MKNRTKRHRAPAPKQALDDYAEYVTHPRFGRRPQITGLDPDPDPALGVFLHWHSPHAVRVPNTAVVADLSRQSPATIPVTHYFDSKRQCRACSRPFLFFAEEQRFWYESLGFPLESDCLECIDCRKQSQGLDRKRERYEALFHAANRTIEEDLDMAECSLSLVEAGTFHIRQLERVRMLLNKLPSDPGTQLRAKVDALRVRLNAASASS